MRCRRRFSLISYSFFLQIGLWDFKLWSCSPDPSKEFHGSFRTSYLEGRAQRPKIVASWTSSDPRLKLSFAWKPLFWLRLRIWTWRTSASPKIATTFLAKELGLKENHWENCKKNTDITDKRCFSRFFSKLTLFNPAF